MFDAAARRLIDPPLNWLGTRLAAVSISANAVTIVGFFVGPDKLRHRHKNGADRSDGKDRYRRGFHVFRLLNHIMSSL